MRLLLSRGMPDALHGRVSVRLLYHRTCGLAILALREREGDLWSAARLLFYPLAGGKAYFLGKGARQVGGILIMQMRGNVHQLFPGKQPPRRTPAD